MPIRNASASPQTGLVLTGGGARAAYQVGALAAVVELLDPDERADFANPFPIICGTSAGAINGAALACRAATPRLGVARLREFWETLHTGHVYRADAAGLLGTGARWLGMLVLGWLAPAIRRNQPRSLLDNRPLEALLKQAIQFEALETNLSSQALTALAVMASGYGSGEHLIFYQSKRAIKPWSRMQRQAVPTAIGIDHLMASSALPFAFPARALDVNGQSEWCGDGSMRQLAPIGPAIHLGADRIVVIGTACAGDTHPEHRDAQAHANPPAYPSLAQIGGHALSSIFLDSIAYDLERLTSINELIEHCQSHANPNTAPNQMRKVDVLVLAPSRSFDDLALEHLPSMPAAARRFLRVLGVTDASARHPHPNPGTGGALLSYLLFEASYTRALIELGYLDTMRRADDVLDFFRGPQG